MRGGMEAVLLAALLVGSPGVGWGETKLGEPRVRETGSSRQLAAKTRMRRAIRGVVYVNRRYGFRFRLPRSWEGYSVVRDVSGGTVESERNPRDHYEVLSIRHPLWTEEIPREDIPIMIFTREQWRRVVDGSLSVSAAPFPPGQIGKNRVYVFAEPPRFFYNYLDGYEEVLRILQGDPMRTFEPGGARVSGAGHRPVAVAKDIIRPNAALKER